MAAILLDSQLPSVANYLILSLAVADLLVAILVMPLGAVYFCTICLNVAKNGSYDQYYSTCGHLVLLSVAQPKKCIF